MVAFTPPNVTLVAPVKLVPVIVTGVPTDPLVGLKLRIAGVTRNILLLVSVPPGVVTVTEPVVALAGTNAVRYVSETTVKVAATPWNETLVAPVKPWPRISMVFPTLPSNRGPTKLTNGPSFMPRLYSTPQKHSFPLPPPSVSP